MLCLGADVGRDGNALMHHTRTAQRGSATLGPLGKTRINLAIRIEETQGLTFAWEKLLEERRSSKTRQFLNSTTSLLRSRHQHALHARTVLFIPGLHRLDPRWQPNLMQRRLHPAHGLHFHPLWDTYSQLFGNPQRLLFIHGYSQGRFFGQRDTYLLLEFLSMPAYERYRAI